MKIKDFRLDEVAMNPSAFAQSLETGASKGVRVGYEFEVCVPEKTIKSFKSPEVTPEIYEKKIQSILSEAGTDILENMADLLDLNNSNLKSFQKYFTPKNAKMSFADAIKQLQNQIKLETKSIVDSVPKTTLRAFMNLRDYKKITYEYNQVRRLSWYLTDRNSKALVKLGNQLSKAIEKIIKRDAGSEVFKLVTGATPKEIIRDLRKYFDYDPKIAYEGYIKPYADDVGVGDDDDDDRYGYEDYDYSGAKKVLKPAIEKAFGARVHTFNEYHEKRKNLDDWYIEPDGSLHPSGDDGAAEVVTPPLKAIEAVQALKTFYGIAKELGLYTNNSTGLHINVSIPAKLDLLKLAIFLGDEYVLKSFDREDSEYAESAMRYLKGEVSAEDFMSKSKKGLTKVDPKKLLGYAKSATEDHMASISDNGKYISFRHAGGDYLSNYGKIANTVGRFIRAMVIASDPKAYREEYLKKLVKIFGEKPAQIFDEDHSFSTRYKRVIDTLKTKGVPAVVIYLYATTGPMALAVKQAIKAADNAHRAPILKYEQLNIEKNSAEAQNIIVAKFQNPERKEKARKSSKNKFLKITLIPPLADAKLMTDYAYTIFFRAVEDNQVNRWDWNKNNFYHVAKETIPLSSPEMKQKYIAAAKAYMQIYKKEVASGQKAKTKPKKTR